jgi:hypothetical protein
LFHTVFSCMEEYKNYIRHKYLENIAGLVLMIFVVASIFVIGKTINPEQKYASLYNGSLSEIK